MTTAKRWTLQDIPWDRFDAAKGTLTPNDPAFATVPPGTGVRHMAFHPNGRLLYAIEEMGSSITAFHYDPASGALHDFQNISTLPEGFKGQSSGAEIAVNAQGTTVYASNRGNDTIAVFHVDPVRFTLSVVDHAPVLGKTPTPRVQDLVVERRARKWFYLYFAAVWLSALALLAERPLAFRLLALLLFASTIGLAVEFVRARRLADVSGALRLPEGARQPALLHALSP